ncbi:MAG: aromatic ring-hydroxylating dioxygenase subunit alpha [Ilumatobacteraceae bacterium]
MSLSQAQIAIIKERASDERARDAYPEPFPDLPPIPAGRYGDPAFAALERDMVFGRSWLMVAHTDQVRNRGDYLLIEHLSIPLFLVRGHDDVIRAHANTCKHRGAALLDQPSGNTGRRLTCPYHSWVYDLEGELVGYPDAENFRELDPACVALTTARCETWGPLVFICLDDDTPPLAEWLTTVAADLSEVADLDGKLHLAGSTVRDVPVNWKLPVDANIETYHVNTVHRDSAGKVLDQASTGIQLLRNGHSRMLISLRDGKQLTGRMPFPPLFTELGDLPDSGTFSYHVFPNLSIVFVGKGFVFLVTNWPSADGGSSYHVHWCSSLASDTDEGRAANDMFIGFNQEVLFEDLLVLPGMQRSIDAGTLEQVNLNYQERRIYHVHEAIDRAIGHELVPEHLRVTPVLGPFVEG